jgi:5,10-methylene-tetrahydrofolate dehydrogenase/methenyl tetrahydrofolate cyclohydrolase
MRLKGKRAIVTGSSTGIGKSIAMMLAGEGAFSFQSHFPHLLASQSAFKA